MHPTRGDGAGGDVLQGPTRTQDGGGDHGGPASGFHQAGEVISSFDSFLAGPLEEDTEDEGQQGVGQETEVELEVEEERKEEGATPVSLRAHECHRRRKSTTATPLMSLPGRGPRLRLGARPRLRLDVCGVRGDGAPWWCWSFGTREPNCDSLIRLQGMGLAHAHGSGDMLTQHMKLGHQEPTLKGDGELASRSLQEEVKRRREAITHLDNSGVGGSQANGAAEGAVQSLGEQVRVLRLGLEARLGTKLKGSYSVLC